MTQSLLRALALATALSHGALLHAQNPIRAEVEALNSAMVAAFKSNPATVARFYTDDASILGGGQRIVGREAIDRYWADATQFADWSLDLIDAGGDATSAWQRGRSILTGKSGRVMVTEFIGILKRDAAGALRFQVDMFVAAPRAGPQ